MCVWRGGGANLNNLEILNVKTQAYLFRVLFPFCSFFRADSLRTWAWMFIFVSCNKGSRKNGGDGDVQCTGGIMMGTLTILQSIV